MNNFLHILMRYDLSWLLFYNLPDGTFFLSQKYRNSKNIDIKHRLPIHALNRSVVYIME